MCVLVCVCVCVCVCVYVCICVCLCVCVHPRRLLITSGVIWLDMDTILLAKQVLQFHIISVVIITSGSGLIIEVHHRNQPNKSKLVLYM